MATHLPLMASQLGFKGLFLQACIAKPKAELQVASGQIHHVSQPQHPGEERR